MLAKKQRLSRSRGTSALRSVRTPNGSGVSGAGGEADQDSSLPTPVQTGDDGASQGTNSNKNWDDQADFDEDALERELLAELEAAEA